MKSHLYKAMIIDDESVVRWGIRDLIDWEAEGFMLCEDGKDGRDGLKKLLSNSPDLALVDIKMPGLSGIELIRTARENGFAGRFIILTGYSEFEFAKSAISLGVEEYLLKPIDEEELGRCIKKIHTELARLEDEHLWHNTNEDVAREELIRNILQMTGTKTAFEQELARYQISFGEDILCTAILSDRLRFFIQEHSDFSEKANDFLRDSSLYFKKTMIDGQIVLISCGIDYQNWAKMLSQRNKRIQAKYNSGLLIAVGNNVTKWYNLCYSYEFAKFMLEQNFLFGHYDVLSMQVIKEQQKKAENPPAEYFIMLAEVGDLDGLTEGVEKFKTYCIKHLMKETDIKIQVLYNLMAIRDNIQKKYNFSVDGITEQMDKINHAEQLESMMVLYNKILTDLCIQIGKNTSNTVIHRMYYYMEKNYNQEMKLESFAKIFNYNANYLGKMFRKEIGDSFNNILDSIRITNAKRLLEETDLKVYQISEQVGYKNIDYFYLKFKKYTGTSPTEYKKNVLGQ